MLCFCLDEPDYSLACPLSSSSSLPWFGGELFPLIDVVEDQITNYDKGRSEAREGRILQKDKTLHNTTFACSRYFFFINRVMRDLFFLSFFCYYGSVDCNYDMKNANWEWCC